MKNKKLHNIITHSNSVTRDIINQYPDLEVKDICKINQLTDLFISVQNNKKLISILEESASKVAKCINEGTLPPPKLKSHKNYKNYAVGDKVKIISTHADDINKIGIIEEVRNSFCKIKILKEDGTPELNPQNNKPIILNHTYSQFKKL
mgnify:FL=1